MEMVISSFLIIVIVGTIETELLRRKMDRLMFCLQTEHPDFYTVYHSARKIVDL